MGVFLSDANPAVWGAVLATYDASASYQVSVGDRVMLRVPLMNPFFWRTWL